MTLTRKRRLHILPKLNNFLNHFGLVLNRTVPSARQQATRAVNEATGGVVQTGPFQGMALDSQLVSWGDGDLAPKLLGTYELELHGILTELASEEPALVINLGSAEGFYAIGMARLIPGAHVLAIDVDPRALMVGQGQALLNSVQDRINFLHAIPKDLVMPRDSRALWIVDIEGGEVTEIDPQRHPGLAESNLIIELHEFIEPRVRDILETRFGSTHTVELVTQSARNPHQIECLAGHPEDVRWAAVSEERSEVGRWLVLRPMAKYDASDAGRVT